MNTREFLQTLFGEAIRPDRRLSIFTLPGGKVRRFDDIAKAIPYIEQQATHENVYFGLSLVSGNPPGRGKYQDMAGITCLWGDLDFAGKDRGKDNLPPDEKAVRNILGKMAFKPSLLVHSGGGFHAYWIFKEPWVFSDDADRAKAALLAKRMNTTLRQLSLEQGCSLDSVGDLTRVLRVPGTLNHKFDPPAEVKVIEANE